MAEKKKKSLTESIKKSSDFLLRKRIESSPESIIAEQAEFMSKYTPSPAQLAAMEKINTMSNQFLKGIEAFKWIANYYASPALEGLKHLGSRGWLISMNLTKSIQIREFYDLAEEKQSSRLIKKLIAAAPQNIPFVIKQTTQLFPERKAILDEILKSYKSKAYYSVVNLCYSQADGMCSDTWGFSFFSKDKKKDFQLKLHLKLSDANLDDFDFSCASQLSMLDNEMTAHSGNNIFADETKRISTFNRHHVMHGQSLEYGTKVNAIRAIYLLDFVTYYVDLHRQSLSAAKSKLPNTEDI